MTARWYVIRTQSNKETQALVHLNNQGYEAYLPRYKKQRRHARKTEMVLRPLFPGYLFVRLDPERQMWRAINSTVGVLGLVQFGTDLACVPDGIVEGIVEREDAEGVVRMAPPDLKPGDSVRIREGAMEDHIGILAEIGDEQRVTLLLNMLGREVRVRVPLEGLARVS